MTVTRAHLRVRRGHLRTLNAAMADEIDYLLASDTQTKASRSTYERMAVASGPTARSEGQR